jgi:hypothetical protein
MHPFISETIVRANQRELERTIGDVHRRRRPPAVRHVPAKEPVLLRLTTIGDLEPLRRLAALECRPEPDCRCVVAEVDGTVVAALPLCGGQVLADPFRPTAHLVTLLELRARQLDAAPGRPPRGRIRGFARALGLA